MKKELDEVEQMNHDAFFERVEKKQFFLSSSALKLLLEDPKEYCKKYVLGEDVSIGSKTMDKGKLVHCMMLEPELLNDNFVNMSVNIPTENTTLCLKYLETLGKGSVELEDYYDEIIDYLKEVNLHQSLMDDKKAPFKTGDDKRFDKINTEEARLYFEFLINSKDKVIIDAAMWDESYAKANALNDNPKINHLFKDTSPEGADADIVETELLVQLNIEGFAFGLKGILDALKISPSEKKMYITDIKTHGGTLKDFTKSVHNYGYWVQGAIYYLLGKELLRLNNAEDFEIVFTFAVVDRQINTYPFVVSEETMETWIKDFTKLVNVEAKYHIEAKDFTLPYEFANNLIHL